MSGSDLGLAVRTHPPVARAGDADQEISIRFDIEAPSAASTPAALELCVLVVGTAEKAAAPPVRACLDALLETLRGSDRLHVADEDQRVVWTPGGAPPDWSRIVEAPLPSLAAGLDRARKTLLEGRREGSALRLFLLVAGPPVENVEALLRATAAITEQSIGVDFFPLRPSIDVGLLTQVANLVGGEVFNPGEGASVAPAIVGRVDLLRHQVVTDVRMELIFASSAQPRRLYRLSPRAAFLGNIRFSPDQPRLVFDVGPVTAGASTSFLLSVGAPRRRSGRFRLIEARLHHRLGVKAQIWTGEVVQRYTTEALDTYFADSSVVHSLDRAAPTAWIEEAAMSYSESDHRRVANTLERLMRRFLELGAPDGQAVVADIRGRYLRSGVLALADFNTLRNRASLIAAS